MSKMSAVPVQIDFLSQELSCENNLKSVCLYQYFFSAKLKHTCKLSKVRVQLLTIIVIDPSSLQLILKRTRTRVLRCISYRSSIKARIVSGFICGNIISVCSSFLVPLVPRESWAS